MTDSPGSPTPDESPEIEEVRRLLAQARHTEPMPDDVVARMDDVLAGLHRSPAEVPVAVAPVASLAVQRRRRAAGLLVAAAAIVVGGVVVAQNLPHGSSGSASPTAGGAQNEAEGVPSPTSSAKAQDLSGSRPTGGRAPKAVLSGGRLLVRPQRFSDDARAGQRLLDTKNTDSLVAGAVSCPSVPSGDGTALPASYRRAPAALLYHPVSGGSQVVDLYLCDSARPVRSATLPAG